MTAKNEIEDTGRVKGSIGLSRFASLPITVEVTLSASEWEAFALHCKKSGSPVAHKIAAQAEEMMQRIEKAKQVLLGKE